jgi:hypothetical protein
VPFFPWPGLNKSKGGELLVSGGKILLRIAGEKPLDDLDGCAAHTAALFDFLRLGGEPGVEIGRDRSDDRNNLRIESRNAAIDLSYALAARSSIRLRSGGLCGH